jgi:hypothetical protein
MVSAVYILAWIAIVYLTVGGILEWLDHQDGPDDDPHDPQGVKG